MPYTNIEDIKTNTYFCKVCEFSAQYEEVFEHERVVHWLNKIKEFKPRNAPPIVVERKEGEPGWAEQEF